MSQTTTQTPNQATAGVLGEGTSTPPIDGITNVEKTSNRETTRQLLSYLWPQGRADLRLFSILAFVCLFLSNLASVYTPVIFRAIVNLLGSTGTTSPTGTLGDFLNLNVQLPTQEAFFFYIGIFLAVQVVALIFQEATSLLLGPVVQNASSRMAVNAFHHVQYLGPRFHTSRRLGALTRVIDRATEAVENLNFMVLSNLLPAILQLVMAIIIMTSLMSWTISLIIIVSIALYVFATIVLTNWRMAYRKRLNAADEDANARSSDSFINFETIMYFASEDIEVRRFKEVRQKYERMAVVTNSTQSVLNFAQGIIFSGATVLVVGWIGYGVLQQSNTIGDYVMVFSYLTMFYGRLGWLGTMYRMIVQSITDVGAMLSLFRYRKEVVDAPGSLPLVVQQGRVSFRNLAFSYNANRQILHNISFDVEAGQKIGLVGTSGSGKTTVTRLLCRLYEPQQGSILIDGQDITLFQQRSIRQQIGIVPQETALFNDTLLYNIAYAKPQASADEIRNAVEAAELSHFVAQLPDGLNTQVGERGVKVSGGERQRIAIARMVLKKPKILVLDEATSSLDTTAEQQIMATIERLFGRCTMLVVAHRLSTVANADKIIVFHKGVIVESGTHQQLLALKGHYAELWLKQSYERQNTNDPVSE